MSDTLGDGGLAFPLHGLDGAIDVGMSLRDYFAARALPALLGDAYNENRREAGRANQYVVTWPISHDEIAAKAYAVADAMLAERARR